MKEWEYDGPAWVRPIGRGIIIEAGPDYGEYLDIILEREFGQGYLVKLQIKAIKADEE